MINDKTQPRQSLKKHLLQRATAMDLETITTGG